MSRLFTLLLILNITLLGVQCDNHKRSIGPQKVEDSTLHPLVAKPVEVPVQQINITPPAEAPHPVIPIKEDVKPEPAIVVAKDKQQEVPNKATNTTKVVQNSNEGPGRTHKIEMETGAMTRGVYVFVACSVLFITYLALKTYCRRKRPAMVRKYGVRARRSDMEMEPLNEDDDEDETLFEVRNNSHH